MKLHAGIAFPDADQFMVKEMKGDQTYQAEHLRDALRFVTEFGCAVDGGAHVGLWSRLMAHSFEKVIAFEPSPDTFECLRHNMQGLDRVQCEPYALGAAPGMVAMTLDAKNALRANTGARHVTAGGEIQVRTIDSFALDRVGFIKLDIEGSEPMALQGAADTIARCQPIILFENKSLWSRHFNLPADAVVRILTRYGYRHLSTVSHDEIWGPA